MKDYSRKKSIHQLRKDKKNLEATLEHFQQLPSYTEERRMKYEY
jgi:hypothetical protein